MKPGQYQIGEAVRQTYGMFARKGVRPNREKQNVSYGNQSVRVHNVNVNGGAPSIPRPIRKLVRAKVHTLAQKIQQHGLSDCLMPDMWHVHGMVAWVRHFHPEEGLRLHQALVYALSSTDL